ncbi:P-loop containing nucleoside triphosphate hydrolase protein [Peniophora sp. CONT]|nr:P-loop containing nucleoside triphosphate hydrolase protein [Peniophora sp. CONT]
MRTQFGGKEPRDFQVELVVAQEARRDALCQAATGQGKTAIAAAPYVLEKNKDRVTIMVSPLIGLQNEMVETFKNEYGLTAVAVNSDKGGCTKQRLEEIVAGQYRIVLISPEMLLGKRFVNRVLRNNAFASRVYSVVVDEAHCISHWGADFRKKYAKLGSIRVFLPRSTPFIAVSASLTRQVTRDVVHSLQFSRGPYLYKNLGNDRTNVSLVVRSIFNSQSSYADLDFVVPDGVHDLDDIPKTWIYIDNIDDGNAIIDRLRSLLPAHLQECVRPYNAVLSSEYRDEAMRYFREGKIRIMICTDAAGMGCNIPDIDVVVQWKLPGKLSSFVQRAGRAARGPGRIGLAVLLVEPSAFTVDVFAAQAGERDTDNNTTGTGSDQPSTQAGKKKGSRKSKKKSELPKGAKGYARSRGRYRGSRGGKEDAIDRSAPEVKTDDLDPTENLHPFVQANKCRRSVLRDVFANPVSEVTVPCCDICNPELLDRVRPGVKPRGSGEARVKFEKEKSVEVEQALDDWCDMVLERDVTNPLSTAANILNETAIDRLSHLPLPLTAQSIKAYLSGKWPLWGRYGQELTDHLLARDFSLSAPSTPDAPDTPIPPASLEAPAPTSTSPTPSTVPTKRTAPESADGEPVDVAGTFSGNTGPAPTNTTTASGASRSSKRPRTAADDAGNHTPVQSTAGQPSGMYHIFIFIADSTLI